MHRSHAPHVARRVLFIAAPSVRRRSMNNLTIRSLGETTLRPHISARLPSPQRLAKRLDSKILVSERLSTSPTMPEIRSPAVPAIDVMLHF
ncbi:hypothetical protein Y032_0011g1458 [Ancylostoma ceylanicum]|uniref:Uncharacterized protein n=1 Tax=Ancylostoma ceylanicum TaxID=53326 RepID=A0A016VES2_9BILA|nr:hypothetical protein Y032_0011g1458 [Ancylostoma ceylanicum]